MSKITRIDVTPRYVDPIYGRFTKRAALINESMLGNFRSWHRSSGSS
jgi:hypothetical protein